MTNEIDIKKQLAEVAILDPIEPALTHSATDFEGVVANARKATAAIVGRFEELTARGINNADSGALTTIMKDAKAADAALCGWADEYRQSLTRILGLHEGLKMFEVQTKGTGRKIDEHSIRGQLRRIADTIREELDARKPAEPMHTYAFTVTCTDAELMAIIKAAGKIVGNSVNWATAQSDAAVVALVKWFEENK